MPVRRRRYGPLYVEQKRREALVARDHDGDPDTDTDDDDEHRTSLPQRPPPGPPGLPGPPPSFPSPTLTLANVVTTPVASITADISHFKQATPTADSNSVLTRTSVIFQTITPSATALAAVGATPTTVIVNQFPPPPPPPKKSGGLSEGTEHLLIAAGSIGATIILVLLFYAFYMMRKKNLTFSEVITGGKRRRDDWGSNLNPQAALPPYEYPAQMKSLPMEPPAALSRQPTSSSQRPLLNRDMSERTERSALRINTTTNNNNQGTFYNDAASPPRRYPGNHNRNVSETPSSPVLPLQQQGRQTPSLPSTRNTRDFDPYTGQPMDQARSPPSFRQFLANRRISIAPKISRFSWNTSNAPQTPRDDLRMSVGTNRSSVARFRTIDSWVGQQSTRVLNGGDSRRVRGASMFPVPDVPPEYQQEPSAPAPLRIQRQPSRKGPQPLLPEVDDESLPGGHIRRDTVGTEATIFRQHPGTEVMIPRGSLVPSEILNAKVKPSAL